MCGVLARTLRSSNFTSAGVVYQRPEAPMERGSLHCSHTPLPSAPLGPANTSNREPRAGTDGEGRKRGVQQYAEILYSHSAPPDSARLCTTARAQPW